MRRCLCSRELLFDRPVGAIADEQIQAIAVHGHRHGRGGAAGRRWNKRATVRYMAKNDARSIADCREALARNPNHFGALSAQRLCHLALSAFREAADLFRRTLAVHPHLESGRANLGTAVDGWCRGTDPRLIAYLVQRLAWALGRPPPPPPAG